MQHTTFSPAPEYLAKLQLAIRQAHHTGSHHESTWMGVELCGSQMWSGSVEVFRLDAGAPAARAFAWSRVEGGQLHCYVVLEDDEVRSPKDAIRQFLSMEESAEEEFAEAV